MDFSKVKLIVTDMDGTLLNSNSDVSAKFFELFKELKTNNIKFIAASGRQYQSIIDKLGSIQNEITIIAENGALVKQGGEELFSNHLEIADLIKPIEILRTLEDTHIVLCGKESAYIETSDENFIKLFRKYYAKYTIVEDLTKVANDKFLKIAAYHFHCSESNIYPSVKHFEENFQVIVSGQNWLDISNSKANKGYALNIIQQNLGITKEETMVFGDYNNDLEMLELAHFSYAMENAHANVKKVAKFTTKSNDNYGVESIIEQVINRNNPS